MKAAAILAVLCLFVAVDAAKWGNDVRHSPCVTDDGTPGDKPEYWTLVFSRSQKDLPNNPAKAQYHDNWAATVQAYPWLGQEAKKVVADIKSNMAYEKLKWSNIDMNLPYTRICIPNAKGIASGQLRKTDYNIHFNPYGTSTDLYSTLFLKVFIRGGKVWEGLGIGVAQHGYQQAS